MTVPTITTTVDGQLDLFAALQARDEGMAAAESASRADHDRAIIDQAIRTIGTTHDTFSSNDIRNYLPDVAPPLIGARFLAAARRGDIERVGDTLASHKAGHARRISTWRLT